MQCRDFKVKNSDRLWGYSSTSGLFMWPGWWEENLTSGQGSFGTSAKCCDTTVNDFFSFFFHFQSYQRMELFDTFSRYLIEWKQLVTFISFSPFNFDICIGNMIGIKCMSDAIDIFDKIFREEKTQLRVIVFPKLWRGIHIILIF